MYALQCERKCFAPSLREQRRVHVRWEQESHIYCFAITRIGLVTVFCERTYSTRVRVRANVFSCIRTYGREPWILTAYSECKKAMQYIALRPHALSLRTV